jgi:TetR/AcrR family transcriptional repressor of nem operon
MVEGRGVAMRVTKAQAEENRAHIVAAASALFRERGYDGVGVAELMAAAGFTHGGFYKHFGSKADLMAETAATTISRAVADSAGVDLAEFFKFCGDAARQSEELKATFAAGIDSMITTLEREAATRNGFDQRKARAAMIDAFAHAVGAVVLSRACPDDSALADEILEICRKKILESLLPAAHNTQASKGKRISAVSRKPAA